MNQTTSHQLRRSEPHYFDRAVFQVENVLFKLPTAPFTNSAVFATIFTLPSGEQGLESTEAKPFVLHGISLVDFKSLLKVMFPLSHNIGELTQQGWISVLKLSTMWEFTEIRERAIQELSKDDMGMEVVEKIECGRKYEVKEWLLEGYNTLLKRAEIASDDEAERLGWKTVVKLYRLRDRCRSTIPSPANKCYNCGTGCYCKFCGPSVVATRITNTPFRTGGFDFIGAIKKEFQEEL